MNIALLAMAMTIAQPPAPSFSSIHGAEESAYQTWVSGLKNGFRPTYVNVHVHNGKPKFSAIAVHNSQSWSARHNLSAADYQREYNAQAAKGFRPVSVSGYTVVNNVRYAAIWLLDTPAHSTMRHGVPAAKYQTEFDAAKMRRQSPSFLSGYAVPGGHEFAVGFEPETGEAVESRHDLTNIQYQKLFDTIGKNGYWPYITSVYNTPAGVRFAAVFAKNPTVEFVAKHGLSASDYQKEFNLQSSRGFRPWNISGYVDGNESRFAGVWVKQALPVSGTNVPQLKAFDEAMLKIMTSRGWTAGALAVSRNGKTVFSHGYGYRDADHLLPVTPETPFRIASVSKPITAAVIRSMVADSTLKLDDKAFTVLGMTSKATGDTRLKEITIEHLLGHRGGWDSKKAKYDPMFDPIEIANKLGRPSPATPNMILEHMLTQPLQFKPGAESQYSNFGYSVLGRVIEKKSGQSFVQELKKRIATPLGMGSLQLGRTQRVARQFNEPEYINLGDSAKNVFDVKGPAISWADGGFHLEAMDSHGGLISNAPDLLKFARAYYIDGRVRSGTEGESCHTGSLPGTYTFLAWRKNNIQIVALFNHRGDNEQAVMDEIFAVADRIVNWP